MGLGLTQPDFSCLGISYNILGIVEARRRVLKVAPSNILLSAIAAICRKREKWQNFDGLSRAHFLSYHFDLLHGISYIICDFRYQKIFPENHSLGKNFLKSENTESERIKDACLNGFCVIS